LLHDDTTHLPQGKTLLKLHMGGCSICPTLTGEIHEGKSAAARHTWQAFVASTKKGFGVKHMFKAHLKYPACTETKAVC
jgi:hypothetical protein